MDGGGRTGADRQVGADTPREPLSAAELAGRLWQGRFCGQRQKWFLMRFTGEDRDIDIATEHPEFDRWQWMAPEALIEKIVPFKRAVYRAVFDAFAGQLAVRRD